MLKIGFTNKYFTLWDVTTEDFYNSFNGKTYKSHTTTHFIYYRNLSMTELEAKKKATKLGCTDLTVDEDLKGKHNSWNSTEMFETPTYDDNQFKYGKYKGKLITESTDINYLNWYSSDADCEIAKKRVTELDSNMCIWDGTLMSKDALKNIKKLEKIKKEFANNGILELVIESNILDDEYKEFRTNVGNFELEPDFKIKKLWYNGYSYYLPLNEKNKSFKINKI